MRAQLKEEKGNVAYQIQIDPEKMEAHKISVIPDYMPDGYHLQEENTSYGEKWYNEKTDGVISIEGYNAAELYRMIETGDSVFPEYDKKDLIKSTEIRGMKADLFMVIPSIQTAKTDRRMYSYFKNHKVMQSGFLHLIHCQMMRF